MDLPINSFAQFNGPQRILSQEPSSFMLFQAQLAVIDSVPMSCQLTAFDWQLMGMQVRFDVYSRWIQALNEGEL